MFICRTWTDTSCKTRWAQASFSFGRTPAASCVQCSTVWGCNWLHQNLRSRGKEGSSVIELFFHCLQRLWKLVVEDSNLIGHLHVRVFAVCVNNISLLLCCLFCTVTTRHWRTSSCWGGESCSRHLWRWCRLCWGNQSLLPRSMVSSFGIYKDH